MPVTKSAKKKLRKDKNRRLMNTKFENLLERGLKKAAKKPTLENVREAIKVIDKSTKKNIIHKNKAARLKSRLSKLIKPVRRPARKKKP